MGTNDRAIAGARDLFGAEHPNTLTTELSRVALLASTDRTDTALAELRAIIASQRLKTSRQQVIHNTTLQELLSYIQRLTSIMSGSFD